MLPWEMLENDHRTRAVFDAAIEQQEDLPSEMGPEQMDWIGMLGAVTARKVAFVDGRGGNGHVMLKIKADMANEIKGRFVMQD